MLISFVAGQAAFWVLYVLFYGQFFDYAYSIAYMRFLFVFAIVGFGALDEMLILYFLGGLLSRRY